MSANCAVCGGPDPLRLGLCPGCGPPARRRDAVIFVDPGARSAERADARSALEALFGDALGSSIRRVSVGRAPLLRLPRDLADHAAVRLADAGVPAVAVASAAAWTRMPMHFFVMLTLVLLTGVLAGLQVSPAMLWLTPVFASLLGMGAQEGMRRPVLRARATGLSAGARAAAASALAEFDDGEPRRLLADIVHLSDRMLKSDGRPADIDAVVISAAATAREVALLTDVRLTLAGRGAADETMARCARMQDDGLTLLRRALAALGSVAAVSGPEAEAARQQLAEITREMEAEAAARATALDIVDRATRTEVAPGQ